MLYLIGNCFSWMCSHGQHPKGRYLGDGEELEDRTNDALNVCYIESPNRLSNSKFNDVDFYVETFAFPAKMMVTWLLMVAQAECFRFGAIMATNPLTDITTKGITGNCTK